MKYEETQIREAACRIRLIAIDMDGTCLSTQKEFTPRTRRAVQALIDRGYIVVPSTGRSFRGLVEQVLGLQGVRYVISADGAFVTDCVSGDLLWKQTIPCSLAAEIVDELLSEGNCTYFNRDDWECTHIMACTSREFYRRHFWRPGFTKPEEVITESLGKHILMEGRDVPKLGVFFTRPDGFEFYESLLAGKYPEVSYFRADENLLEVTAGNTSKGKALRHLAESLGISREEICAFGDNGNDIEMLEYAGLGIAMGNAIPSLLERADFVTGTNDEEGVACFLERFLGDA